jgi:hypothetical protein
LARSTISEDDRNPAQRAFNHDHKNGGEVAGVMTITCPYIAESLRFKENLSVRLWEWAAAISGGHLPVSAL